MNSQIEIPIPDMSCFKLLREIHVLSWSCSHFKISKIWLVNVLIMMHVFFPLLGSFCAEGLAWIERIFENYNGKCLFIVLIMIMMCRYDVMLARFRDSDPRHVHDSALDSI